MAFKISELKFPQWPVNQNFIFDMTANWIDKTFFGSKYSPTPEKTMIIALCTNIFGLHRVYAGRKISAVVGWFFLFLSLIAREYVFMLLFWLAVDMVRICLCNYGRVKSKQGFNLHELKKLLFRKAGRGGMAISGSVSVLALALLLAFAPKAESKPRDLTVSRSDLYVSQTDAAYSDLQELEAQIESKSSLMEEMNLYDQNREKNQAQIESLKKEIADLMADKQSLQSELQELKSEIESQKKLLEKMQKQTDELIKAQQSTTTKATTTQKSTTTTAKKAITTTKKPTTKKSTTTTKKTTTTTKKPTTTTKKTTTKKVKNKSTTAYDSENSHDYDTLQMIFLKLNFNTTESDIEKYIKAYQVEYTKEEYNGYNSFKLAYNSNVALQSYADEGDHLDITFSQKDGSFMYADYFKLDTFKVALLYNHGTYWEFRFEPNNKYSGYYYYLPGETPNKNCIVIEYENGRRRQTHYHACDDAETALQKCLEK